MGFQALENIFFWCVLAWQTHHILKNTDEWENLANSFKNGCFENALF